MLKQKLTYGTIRRLLGLSGLFAWLVLAALGIWGEAGAWFAACGHSPVVALGTFWGLYVVIHTPFDFLGGFVLPKVYGQASLNFISWLGKWSRGVLLHAAMLWASSLIIFAVADQWGEWMAVVWVTIQMFLMTQFQLPLARLFTSIRIGKVSRFRSQKDPELDDFRFYTVESEDQAFTGGVVGVPGKESIVLPFSWKNKISEEIFSILRARRVGAVLSGSRTRGLFLAVVWNVIWFAIAVFLSSSPLASIEGIIETSLWFTLFCGLGLLGFLPFWSRRGSIEIDGWTHQQGACEFDIQKAISFSNNMQGDDPCRPQWQEKSFASTPSVENRLMHLFMNKKRRGAWHAAQYMLYLSWAGLGLVSRSIPCNLGRPDLWVIFPCD
jgi:hypothetical protein